MIEKPIAGPVHEPPSEHHLRCDAGPPAGRYERQHCGTPLLPQCANICVTTAAGANDDTRESQERRPPDPPFSFQVVTVIDPEALNGAYPQPQQPVLRSALRNLRGRRYADDAVLRRNLLFRSTSSSLPRRRPLSWRKEAGGLRSARCKLRPHRVPAGPASPKAAPAAGHPNLSDDLIREEITKLVLDDHFAPSAAENAVVGGDFEGAAEPAAAARQKAAEQPAPENAPPPAAQTRQPEPVIQLKKKKKKKKAKPEKKKFNLMKFKQKVPIEGTGYQMEVYLEKEVIDRTRKGKIDISKDPKVEVKYNKVADLRDEFSSYCSERKKLKNWLFYA